ncbi:MAG: hypothetical protein KDA32_05020 [Phycisphaerales bacterium]|nr:hypothetical protein [Phycisphaerales bacterium]
MKELQCLYAVSQIIVEPSLTRAERMRRIVSTLPRAWQHPDSAVARITLDNDVFASAGGEPLLAACGAELVVEAEPRGMVEVGYPSVLPGDADPFLAEERTLLENVARQVSLYITREEGAERRKLLEEQLRHADRLATIGQLAAGVAHEMNEPLSSILGFAQLALKSVDVPQQVAADLREIVGSSLRAREIVKKLLLFARQTPPSMRACNLNQVVDEALFLLAAGGQRQGIEFARRLTAELPELEADPTQLRQVVVNLLVNATQAISARGRIEVATRLDGNHVELAVADTGCGMTPEVLKQVFNPFYTTKDVGEGTGLGLSVAHGIIIAHGGTIHVESVLGKGSRFVVRLPCRSIGTGSGRSGP